MEKKSRKSKVKKALQFDPLDVTESLGYKTYRKNGRNSWSKEEDDDLRAVMHTMFVELGYPNGINDVKTIQESEIACGKVSWENIAMQFKNGLRKPKDLRKRWTASLDPNLKKGKWAPEEDVILLKSYEKHGPHWLSVAEEISGRTEDQCAKRYIEILGPSSEGRLRKWTLEEDLSLVSKVKMYGTKWRRISSELESRPSLTCRNRWRKIITSVVRGRATPEIIEAVKAKQDINLVRASVRPRLKGTVSSQQNSLHEEEADEEDEGDEEMGVEVNISDADGAIAEREQRTSLSSIKALEHNSSHKNLTEKDASSEEENMRKGRLKSSHQMGAEKLSIQAKRDSNNHLLESRERGEIENDDEIGVHHMPSEVRIEGCDVDDVYDQRLKITDTHKRLIRNENIKILKETDKSLPLIKNLSPLPTRSVKHATKSQPPLSASRSPISTAIETSPPLSNDYAKGLTARANQASSIAHQTGDTPLNSRTGIPQELIKPSMQHTGQMEWKFTLKDGQGLSISSGTISNTELVKELVDQARKYSLKISIHQHIHNHYGGQAENNSTHENIPDSLRTLRTNNFSTSNNGIGSLGTDNHFFNSPNEYKAPFAGIDNDNDNDFLSQPPNYNVFGLEPSPQIETSNLNNTADFYSKDQGQQTHASPGYSGRPGTTSSTGSHSTAGDEVHEIGRNRVSHFNYLPTTVRPQLGSSDSTRATDLTKLLNPSPGVTHTNKRKKKRKKSVHSEGAASFSSHQGSEQTSPTGTNSRNAKSLDTPGTTSSLNEEEGPDFWESLRSLAAQPTSDEEGSHPPAYEEEDYELLYSLFNTRTETLHLDKANEELIKGSNSAEKETILPLNPS